MASRRKRLKLATRETSQPSIKTFFLLKHVRDVSCAVKESNSQSQSSSEVKSSFVTASTKKQSLLAPFHKKQATINRELKTMSNDSASLCKSFTRVGSFDEREHGSDIYEFNSQDELRKVIIDLDSCEEGTTTTADDNLFGLFGISSSDDEELENYFDSEMAELNRKYFDNIPDEILEEIFCQLPLIDLMVNLSVVCKRWYRIISSENFLPWKKLYYQYKCNCVEAMEKVKKILHDEQLNDMTIFPISLIRFMSKFRHKSKEDFSLFEALKHHSKFSLIEKFHEQFSEEGQSKSCWSAIGLLTLVSSTVYDIQEIILCFMRTSLSLIHVIECLYCVALVYFAIMETQLNKYSSYHYRIYYALYLYENSSHCTHSSLGSALNANKSGQQTILKYRQPTDSTWMTHEQVRIMNHNTKPGDTLKIVAFAGTGKTTTLIEYTKLRPSWTFLNVAYNKSVQEQAVRKFPTNVISRTVHSLAFREVGYSFKRKLASSIHVKNVMENLPGEQTSKFLHAKRVASTLEAFISSSDSTITLEHVPYQQAAFIESEEDRQNVQYFNSEPYLKIVVRDAKAMWCKMSDRNDMDARITHDGYLKLYQLSKPVINSYDCILIDEAQDCTPAVADVLLNQDVAKILVGDPHQQIYGFRGATNAMALISETHTYYLTQSFRFGPEIASVASSLLDIMKGVRRKTIVGIQRKGGIHGDQHGQLAIICRTNCTLFNNAVLVCKNDKKIRISFAGGIQGYSLDRILDIYRLHTGCAQNIKDKFIKMFKTFVDLKKYAKRAPDPELLGKIKIVETHNINVASHIEMLKKQYCKDPDQADIVFSTAHKSKGLEFDTVRVAEDFLIDVHLSSLPVIPIDEKNLLYVAVTRAKHRVQLPTTLYHILIESTDLFMECEALPAVKDKSTTFCTKCKNICDFNESYVAVKRSEVTLGTSQKIDGGFLCVSCVFKNAPVLGNMVINNKKKI